MLGTIYMISCLDEEIEDIYIGSTFNFKARERDHKYNSKTPTCSKYDYPLYKKIREHGGWANWRMSTLIEEEFESKAELVVQEGNYQLAYGASLNGCIAGKKYLTVQEIC